MYSFIRLYILLLLGIGGITSAFSETPIDRQALVTRNSPHLTTPGRIQVGNGEFAFSADLTGLQTVEECCTMAQWGWHTSPLPEGAKIEDFACTPKESYAGRTIPYRAGNDTAISKWLYANPHRLNLGRLFLARGGEAAAPITAADIVAPNQSLDLWNGVLESRFTLDGAPVTVTTCSHPSLDAVAVRIVSPLLADQRLLVRLDFPYPDLNEFGGYGDFNRPADHTTVMKKMGEHRVDFDRTLDEDHYTTALAWTGAAALKEEAVAHRYVLTASQGDTLEFLLAFAPRNLPGDLPGMKDTLAANRSYWNDFWSRGGAIDLSGSTDPRAAELERRIVLSQYLTAVNCAGSLPPQESGLVNNGWNGKFHFEMYWWHGAHYALWNRWPLLRRSLDIYDRLLPSAREKAAEQGYRGARWPKCTGPEGRESPHPIHAMLAWQQPHPIFFAELDYRAHPDRVTLERWRDVVAETAAFMADFLVYEKEADRYVLGPPIYTVPETTDPDKVYNPAFELASWRFGLEKAQLWRERLGRGRDEKWDEILRKLAPIPQADGIYLLEEHLPDSYTRWNHNHPSVAGILGIFPGTGVDPAIMGATLDKIHTCWQWPRTWGWDFPMLAMTAARLGRPEEALAFLFHENFTFDDRGYPKEGGPWPYLPSSGALLYATALMAGGWEGAPAEKAPGFPADGQWQVHVEGIAKAP